MSELLKEFIAESRDLIEQAGQTLLDLEDNPKDSVALNSLFRHVHTIKGGAGLFDPPGLVPTLHAAEDLLDRLREDELSLTPEMTDVLLRALDQVVVWLEMLERDGVLDAGQSEIGLALAKNLAAFVPESEAESASEVPTEEDEQLDWLSEIPTDLTASKSTCLAIEFTPDETCFFTGANPIVTAMAVPGRRWMKIDPRDDWPDPDEMDPFTCNVTFKIVSVAPRDAIDQHLAYVQDQCRVQTLAAARSEPEELPPDRALAIEILEAQRDALTEVADAAVWPGRMTALAALLGIFEESFGLQGLRASSEAGFEAATPNTIDPAIAALNSAVAALHGARKTADAPIAKEEAPTSMRRDSTTIKVEQDVMDQMVKLVGEMIVAKNALPFLVKRAEEVHGNRRLALEIKSDYEAINRIVEDMQTSVMQMRMVPVSQVFQRYQRLVRDLSRRLDKKIALEMVGEDTKADKNIVEELADPLVHLIRNACDHGLEAPKERVAAGKSESGHLTLSARQVEDQVVIAVKDDGRGINIGRVREKAVENGLLPMEEVERLDDKSAMQLILQPGFSTAEQVSDLSGRGVGMDVVNTMVKRSGGTMWIDSDPGAGSEISISLPMSVAVSQVMMFEVGPTLYGITIENIVETVRIPTKDIHRFKTVEQIMLRGRLVPLLRAREIFQLPNTDDAPDDELSVLVVRNGDDEIGLVVDRVRSEADVKLEALDDCLNSSGYFSGAALLGDGSIMLLVSARELF